MVVLLFAKLISTEESENLKNIDLKKVYSHSMESVKCSIGHHALKTDLCVEALAYLSLKDQFKKSYLIQNMQQICSHIDSLSYQAFVFMVLNMCRDSNFDTIPSYAI
jgi:hypothetical protein